MAKRAHAFEAALWRYPGPGGWFFVDVPEHHAPPVTGPFGRTPVRARVDDGPEWQTSVWRDSKRGTLLAIPKRHRGGKGEGDVVTVRLTFDPARV